MTRSVCTCDDCTIGVHIEEVEGRFESVWVVTVRDEDTDSPTGYLWEGDECDRDHDHTESDNCAEQYRCESCYSMHDYAEDAESCCKGWMCCECGETFTSNYYGDPKDTAKECCHYRCETCGFGGWADDHYDHECDNGKGKMRRAMPWEARGIKVDARRPQADEDWRGLWAIQPEEHDVVRSAADYYLLEAISAGLVGTSDGNGNVNAQVQNSTPVKLVRREADRQINELVNRFDPVFIAYTHMAVGGELRHHNAVGGEVLSNNNRDRAWTGWKLIFDAVGPDALKDAAELFREFTGGGFGGEPWAQAAEILYNRLTNKITPRIFLDRIFNAQHNGGCLLNKVTWKSERIDNDGGRISDKQYSKVIEIREMTDAVLPAHGMAPEPDYVTLLAYCTAPVRVLFSEAWEAAGHGARDVGVALHFRCMKPKKGQTKREKRYAKALMEAAKYAQYADNPDALYYAKAADKAQANANLWALEAEAEKATNAMILAATGDTKICLEVKCECGVPECELTNMKYYSSHASEMLTSYTQLVKQNLKHLEEAIKQSEKQKKDKATVADIMCGKKKLTKLQQEKVAKFQQRYSWITLEDAVSHLVCNGWKTADY
jgi:hypothetical protein